VWSTLEYGCHVRDVHRIFNHRVQLMLGEDEPQFPNWDQDETAIADHYASQNPSTVATELFDAATVVADTYADVPADAWSRRGLRSNGSEFTVASIAIESYVARRTPGFSHRGERVKFAGGVIGGSCLCGGVSGVWQGRSHAERSAVSGRVRRRTGGVRRADRGGLPGGVQHRVGAAS
jgi:hypothetical protein